MRLLGLDPGLRHTGWGIINTKDDNISWIASGNVSPKNSLCISERLKIIHNELNEIINEFKPYVVAVEEVFDNKPTVGALVKPANVIAGLEVVSNSAPVKVIVKPVKVL